MANRLALRLGRWTIGCAGIARRPGHRRRALGVDGRELGRVTGDGHARVDGRRTAGHLRRRCAIRTLVDCEGTGATDGSCGDRSEIRSVAGRAIRSAGVIHGRERGGRDRSDRAGSERRLLR